MFTIGTFPTLMAFTLWFAVAPDFPHRLCRRVYLNCAALWRRFRPNPGRGFPGNSGKGNKKGRKKAKKESAAGDRTERATDDVARPRPDRFRRRPAAVAFVAVFIGWNVLFPLRHYLIEGPVEVTSEGNDFAWRMKLFTRSGDGHFTVEIDKRGDGTFSPMLRRGRHGGGGGAPMRVGLADIARAGLLHPRQATWCGRIPEYLVQCARAFGGFIAERETGGDPARVRVFAHWTFAFNYRASVPLTNATVDLMTAGSGGMFGHAPWVLAPPADYLLLA